jgi:predicted AAA+ superfamily ATPase
MIWNIIDRRSRHYRWKLVSAVIEAVEHGDSCADADQVREVSSMEVIDNDQREGVSVAEALEWANVQRCAVTLYLYDNGKATTNEGHFNAAENWL